MGICPAVTEADGKAALKGILALMESDPAPGASDSKRKPKGPRLLKICVRDGLAGGSRLYGLCFREHFRPEFWGQISGGQQIDLNAEQGFQLVLQAAEIEQRGVG